MVISVSCDLLLHGTADDLMNECLEQIGAYTGAFKLKFITFAESSGNESRDY